MVSIQATLKSRSFPEQAYRSCLGILSLATKYPASCIEQAHQADLETKSLSDKTVKDESEWLMKQTVTATPETLPVHDNIRGHEYYQLRTLIMISQTLLENLLQLRLTAFRKGLQEQATNPKYADLPFEEQLLLLVELECIHRSDNGN